MFKNDFSFGDKGMFHYKYKKLKYNYHFFSLRKCKNLSKICYILNHERQK